jgi:hypothetical protein
MKTFLGWPALAIALLLTPPRGLGCTIPVYRYALERWELARYDLVVFHRGPLAHESSAELQRWRERANLEITLVDLDGAVKPELQRVWQRQENKATLPWLVLHMPGSDTDKTIACAVPFTPRNLAALGDSGARQRIVAALRGGETAVFVLLAGGDTQRAEAVGRVVEDELRRLEKALKLPEQSKDGPQLRLPLPLQVRFTFLPLRRDEPGEEAFVRMLLATEEGLDKVKGPILFPIFGRGRALGSLYGKDLNAGDVFEVAQFLCKECSCQLKELNPGTDLLIRADWPAIFESIMKDSPVETVVSARPVPIAAARIRRIAPVAPRDWLSWSAGCIVGFIMLARARMLATKKS